MHRTLTALALAASVAGVVLPAPARAEPAQQLDAGEQVLCLEDPAGNRMRVQCDDAAKRCLYARACIGEPCVDLERTTYCSYPAEGQSWSELAAKGYLFVPGKADVLAGFYRDDEGRAFQVSFDLNQRMWLGGSYLHTFREDGSERQGVRLDLGFRVDTLVDNDRERNRFRFLELSLVPDPLSMRASLLRFDTSSGGDEPFLRVTTFIGGPARHDLYIQGGWWLDLLSIDHRPRGSEADSMLRVLAGGVTWDLWQDPDMTSFLRFKLGLAFEDAIQLDRDRGRFGLVPLVALEGDFTFDDQGFHHLVLTSRFEAAFIEDPASEQMVYHRRFDNELAYELILIALNDQPVSLRAGVTGGYRDDLAADNGWEVAVDAGLRFSLWAPPRDLEARDRIVAKRKRETGP